MSVNMTLSCLNLTLSYSYDSPHIEETHAMSYLDIKEARAIRRRATSIYRWALKSGKLPKPVQCKCCGSTYRVVGHHPDYAKPLKIIELCTPCHAATHRRERNKLGISGRNPNTRKAKYFYTPCCAKRFGLVVKVPVPLAQDCGPICTYGTHCSPVS